MYTKLWQRWGATKRISDSEFSDLADHANFRSIFSLVISFCIFCKEAKFNTGFVVKTNKNNFMVSKNCNLNV
jgi:hypothetical protein